ncbi:MAG: LysR family transcriptional regulator [Moritella sp.]|uniref:LysR family transcriptional regulator n=1 Tax=Moritella sp. TaxID=78556 RepID=UPI0029B1D0C9|nr:LysR family transcriptional regulator [Moritella sp.]MDX2322334.1 LysR family transcriptional regulator [Moritella sp.]
MINLQRINLNLLLSLQYLLQEQQVTAAAQRQFITQSAMSKNLAKLREIFADPLLIKIDNKSQLTEKAKQLKPVLAQILNNIDGLLVTGGFDPLQSQREFTIASTDYVTDYILPVAVAYLYQHAPNIKLNLTYWDKFTLAAMERGEIDLGATIIRPEHKHLSYLPLEQDSYVCIMRQGHPLEQVPLTLSNYTQYPHGIITSGADKSSDIDVALSAQGLFRDVALRIPSYSSAFSIIAKTDHLLTIPNSIADKLIIGEQFTRKKLPIKLPILQAAIIWHPRFDHDLAHKWLRDELHAQLICNIPNGTTEE